MSKLDETHDASRKSWLESANDATCFFPIQNLPYGVFTTSDDTTPRVGVAIGDQVLDLAVLERAGLLVPSPGKSVFDKSDINAFMALGRETWRKTRVALSTWLEASASQLRDDTALRKQALVPLGAVTLLRPISVRGYTDFYASKEHATNVGAMFRDPKNALLPNWVHIPIGYNGRASTVVVSGTRVRRPMGQIKPPNSEAPVFAPCGKLDFELEVGAIVGQESAMGKPMTLAQAQDAIFGYVLLNDWSARDIQQWEYVPLGPFQGKVFATSISPWVVTADALEPFRVAGPEQVPPPLPYLRQHEPSNYDLHLEVAIAPKGHPETTICRTNFKGMYWSSAQQLAHHSCGGCAMEIGDLLGSGTVSGTENGSFGSLLELSRNGANPIAMRGGGERRFIEDGDEVVMTGWCAGNGYRVGFGEVRGQILPARYSAIS